MAPQVCKVIKSGNGAVVVLPSGWHLRWFERSGGFDSCRIWKFASYRQSATGTFLGRA